MLSNQFKKNMLVYFGIIFFGSIGCTDTSSEDETTDDSGIDIMTPTDTTNEFIEINIVHHISRNDQGGNPVANTTTVEALMNQLNTNFSTLGIRFITKEIKFLDNTAWNIQFVKQDDFIEQRVLEPFEDPNSLNIFYFNEIGNRENGVITGTLGATALFPDQGNNIKLSASAYALDNTATVTHEIGHYFGLYHTSDDFTDANGHLELVNGSNCATSGDFICDTPASPDLNDSNINEPTCNYIGTETDTNGDAYTPDTFNYMTQWAGTDVNGFLCRRRFSNGQVEKMIEVLTTLRPYLQ